MKHLLKEATLPPGLENDAGFAYTLSKKFVVWYAQKCAHEYAKKGIRVVSVSPGLIETDMGTREVEAWDYAKEMIENTCEHRMGTAAEMGFTIAMIADERNGYLRGIDVLVDGGASTGAGIYDDFLLTDTLGDFSVGVWRFTITDTDNTITGTVNQNIHAGENDVAITVHSKSSSGTLSVEGCNFILSKAGNVLYVDLYIDNERVNTGWVTAQLESEDGDYYELPTVSEKLREGVHTVRLYYATDNGGTSSDTVSVRIVGGMTTHFSIGEQEGTLSFSVSFDIQGALV